MDLIPDSQKAFLQGGIHDVHDTWSRPLTYFNAPEKLYMYNTGSYISQFGDAQPAAGVTNVISSGIINCRIFYPSSQLRYKKEAAGIDISLLIAQGDCRLKMLISDYQLIRNHQNIQIDSQNFVVNSAQRVHGLFTPEYIMIWLKKTD